MGNAETAMSAGLRAAIEGKASPDPQEAVASWCTIAAYLSSPLAVAATLGVGIPHIARLPLDLLGWATNKGCGRAA